jgi:hypothetical protein
MYLEVFLKSAFITTLVGTSIGYIVAATRKASWALKVRPQRMELLSTTVAPGKSLASIVIFAQASGYKISNLDETENRVVLEEPTSLWSYGFFFPIFISIQSDGSTAISIGIRSKFIQYGPIVGRSHRKCVNGIKAALAEQI